MPSIHAHIHTYRHIPVHTSVRLGYTPPLRIDSELAQITLRGNTDAKLKTLIARVVRPALFGLICAIPYAVVYAYRFGNVRFRFKIGRFAH